MSEALIAGLFGILVAGVSWTFNEYAQRRAAGYVRRERRYQRLVTLLRGFYESSADPLQREEFIVELRACV